MDEKYMICESCCKFGTDACPYSFIECSEICDEYIMMEDDGK